MPSTSFHISEALLERIDQLAKEKGISRNRFIIQACEQAVESDAGQWPEDFFESELGDEDGELLRKAASEMEQAILSRRRNRSSPAL